MISRYTSLLNNLSQKRASRLHFGSSTVAAILFGLVAIGTLPVWILPLIGVLDLSTAYTVIAGVNADRYLRLPYPDVFYITHVIPGKASYGILILYLLSLVVYPLQSLFWAFLALWIVAYVTGAYAFFKLR